MTLVLPWDGTWDDFDPADLWDENEWLARAEQERLAESEADDE